MKLLHFSNSSGEIEYVVIVEDSQATPQNARDYARSDASLDGIYDVTVSAFTPRATLEQLPIDSELTRH